MCESSWRFLFLFVYSVLFFFSFSSPPGAGDKRTQQNKVYDHHCHCQLRCCTLYYCNHYAGKTAPNTYYNVCIHTHTYAHTHASAQHTHVRTHTLHYKHTCARARTHTHPHTCARAHRERESGGQVVTCAWVQMSSHHIVLSVFRSRLDLLECYLLVCLFSDLPVRRIFG